SWENRFGTGKNDMLWLPRSGRKKSSIDPPPKFPLPVALLAYPACLFSSTLTEQRINENVNSV
ncbi:hypothetical protein, partial [Brucella anthropi]|uniref:hypothetical protein n=1 Tax=Brucella anthropi TaxID=529 RepID=UPI001AEC1A79